MNNLTYHHYKPQAISVVLTLILITFFCHFKVIAQSEGSFWTDVSESSITAKGARYTIPQKYRTLALDVKAMQDLLAQAPNEKNTDLRSSRTIITLPLPDGKLAKFRFIETATMAPELASKFPDIKTFTGIGIDDPNLTAAFDFTTTGFHGMIHSASGLSFIDPYSQGEIKNYIAYAKIDYVSAQKKAFFEPDVLGTETENAKKIAALVTKRRAERSLQGAAKPSGDELRTYRVAIAATGEYTAFYGGTVSAALSGITTTLNRVNFIYIREVDVRMQLVANETSIIYTNSATDPYSNGNPGAMIGQAQTNIDNIIGNANYDIGHVFGTNSGGLAGLGVVCQTGIKARGVTGSAAPIGDPFDVDYVAHEMGHQFGANHTFNGNAGSCSGNRNAGTAFEPGSGSTIMAYAGICGSQDLQPNSDAYFHTASYDEIFAYTEFGAGSTCPVVTNPINTAPEPVILTTNNLTIPKQTPFTITGTATDFHNDPITYNWEEYDLGPEGSPTAPSGNAPIFRSFTATSDGSRTFPKQSDLLNNTSTIGEILPTYARTLVFNLTVRDNYSFGGGVSWAYPLNINVSGSAGPFLVTYPNTNVSLAGGSVQSVSWNVAGTNAAPINTANVNILLSTNGGVSFPTVLASNTPNDGIQSVTLPNISTASARIKVEAVGNIYFDISNANFSITPTPAPTIISFEPISGPSGVAVYVKGSNFINVSAVRFNGIAATEIYNAGTSSLYATVPAGATTGKIQVAAQGGSALSATNFTVAPIVSQWLNKTALATARSQHGAIAANGKIYVFGGVNTTGPLTSLEIYNPATNTWSPGAPMPGASRGMSFALGFNGMIYVVSGYDVSLTTSLYRYNPATNTWATLASIPDGVWEGAAAATSNGKIYVFGGEPSLGGSTNTTRIYNIATNTWSLGANMPVSVQQHAAVASKAGKIYIIGGRSAASSAPVANVQIYDPLTNTWGAGAPMIVPKVQFGAALSSNGKIYVVGGKVNYTNNVGPFFHSVEIYNITTNAWSSGPVSRARAGELEAVNLNDDIYSIAGTDGTYRKYNFQLVIAPIAPGNLTAAAISSTKIQLSWVDRSLNETNFVIQRATSASGPFTTIATTGANVTTYTNVGLTAGTTYYYRLRTENAAGSSAYSNIAQAKTLTAFASSENEDLKVESGLTNSLAASPNPMQQQTTISFRLTKDQKVQLIVFGMDGRMIKQLYEGNIEAGKNYKFEWNAGAQVSGTYVARLVTQDGILSKNIILKK